MRRRPKPRGRGAFGTAIFVGLLGVGAMFLPMGRSGHFKQHEFPGFDVSLPRGEEIAGSTAYAIGRGGVRTGTGLVQVSWRPGGLSAAEDESAIIQGMQLAAQDHTEANRKNMIFPIPEALPTKSIVLSWPEVSAARTEIACGARRIAILVVIRWGSVEETTRRSLAGFRCRPDFVRERSIEDLPVVLDVGPGWYERPGRPGQLKLTNARETVVVQSYTGNLDRVADLLPDLLAPMKVGARRGDRWPLSLEGGGQLLRGAVELRDCPEHGRTFLVMWLSPDADDAPDLLRKVRCRGVNEAPQLWPTAHTQSDAQRP